MVPPALAMLGAVLVTCKSATGLIGVLAVELLSPVLGSSVPAGGVMFAVLTMMPVVLPATAPVTVRPTSPPLGRFAITPDTVLPLIVIGAGQLAPLMALVQLAATPVILLGTASLKLAAFAALGPALRMRIW